MTDLTLLYYTANRIDLRFQRAVAEELFNVAMGLPIRAVSQQELPFFGDDWIEEVVGPIGASIYNVYRQVLLAAKMARTPFVACCEDDTLYASSHFEYRPPLDTFAYDLSRWVITRELAPDSRSRVAKYYWRQRTQMAMCIAPRVLLVETLEERFAAYPTPVDHETAKKTGWGEPGRYEKNLKLTPRKLHYFRSSEPSITFNHSASLMGRRRVNVGDIIREDLPPWGNATSLWSRIHG